MVINALNQAPQLPLSSRFQEIEAALFQIVVTLGLALLTSLLYRRHRKEYFAWFAGAFSLYVLRLLVILAFLATENWTWLYWHQVATGWTALALLRAAWVFWSPGSLSPAWALALLFPVAWSWVAIYILESFLWAALPAVLFLATVTAATGAIFISHWRRTRRPGAALLGVAFALWSIHHLDYPFLRAQGAWVPWGYYLDSLFILLVGAGLLLLVADELRGGLTAMMALAEPGDDTSELQHLLRQAAHLPAATGAAIFSAERPERPILAVGECSTWMQTCAPVEVTPLLVRVRVNGLPIVRTSHPAGPQRYHAVLPIPRSTTTSQTLVVVGDGRHPFTALDDEVLAAVGRQLGAALDRDELNSRLAARSDDLARLSVRMLQQHEEERHRLSLELHDETAQVLAAVKLRLGLLQEGASTGEAREIRGITELVDQGMRSIRGVTEMLRPAALDDLGLPAALRSLAAEFQQSTGVSVNFTLEGDPTMVPADAGLVLFRSMQEGLSNAVRHGRADSVRAALEVSHDHVLMRVADNGRYETAEFDIDRLQRAGHTGLAGIRERVGALGGSVTLGAAAEGIGGTVLTVRIPIIDPETE
ncbi:MAG: histidine kinase [Gemmatimonadota bacterium]